jgi:hypothetical protein
MLIVDEQERCANAIVLACRNRDPATTWAERLLGYKLAVTVTGRLMRSLAITLLALLTLLLVPTAQAENTNTCSRMWTSPGSVDTGLLGG